VIRAISATSLNLGISCSFQGVIFLPGYLLAERFFLSTITSLPSDHAILIHPSTAFVCRESLTLCVGNV
jgi:hypothetical protein